PARHEVVVEQLHRRAILCGVEAGAPGAAGNSGPSRMRSTGVHHVDLVVSSIERSLPFYRDLLGPLGWHGVTEVAGERGETIWYLWGPGTSIGLREAGAARSQSGPCGAPPPRSAGARRGRRPTAPTTATGSGSTISPSRPPRGPS